MPTKVKRKPFPPPVRVEEKVQQDEVVLLEETTAEAAGIDPVVPPGPRLEVALWVAVILLAVILRLWDLGLYPLSNAEAAQSLVALQLYRGNSPEPGPYSPLLLSLNALSFLLFSPTETAARLASFLLGSGLVLLPLAFRRQLGQTTSLLAAALLALSPSAVFLSRTLNSEIGVAVGALMLVAGFFNWAEQGRPGWLLLAAGGLAGLLASGPLAYSIIVVFGLIVLVRLPAFKALWLQGTRGTPPLPPPEPIEPTEPGEEIEPDEVLPQAGSSNGPEVHRPAEKKESSPISVPPGLRQAGLLFLAALVLFSTAALFNLAGFSVLANLPLEWLSRFGLQTQPEAGFNAVFLLTLYEPLLVFAGLVGLAYAVLRGNLLELGFGLWFMGLLLLDLLMGGRPNAGVILPLVPLAFLAAIALADLVAGLRDWGSWGNEGLLLVTGLVILAFAYISLTGWLVRVCGPDDRVCQLAWLQPVAAVSLLIIILVFFWLITTPGAVLRGMALLGVALGLMVAINTGARLNYGPLANLAYQPLAGLPASAELPLLAETLAFEGAKRVGDTSLLDVTLVGPTGASLPWLLRDYDEVRLVDTLTEANVSTAVITPPGTQELGLGQAYVGQDFALDAVWSPVGLAAKDLVKWLIYREANDLPRGNEVILWLRVE